MPADDQILRKRLAQLQRYADRLEALHLFLTEHPYLAAESSLKVISGGAALILHEKAFVRPMGRDGVRLRLERYLESYEDVDDRIVCEDVSRLTKLQLAVQLRKVGIRCSGSEDQKRKPVRAAKAHPQPGERQT